MSTLPRSWDSARELDPRLLKDDPAAHRLVRQRQDWLENRQSADRKMPVRTTHRRAGRAPSVPQLVTMAPPRTKPQAKPQAQPRSPPGPQLVTMAPPQAQAQAQLEAQPRILPRLLPKPQLENMPPAIAQLQAQSQAQTRTLPRLLPKPPKLVTMPPPLSSTQPHDLPKPQPLAVAHLSGIRNPKLRPSTGNRFLDMFRPPIQPQQGSSAAKEKESSKTSPKKAAGKRVMSWVEEMERDMKGVRMDLDGTTERGMMADRDTESESSEDGSLVAQEGSMLMNSFVGQ